MLNTVPLSEFHQFEYNDYIFVENLTLAIHNAEQAVIICGDESAWNNHFSEAGESLSFPYLSTMICYHDEKKILMFLGLDLNEKYLEESKELFKSGDIETFLETYFYFYDFSE